VRYSLPPDVRQKAKGRRQKAKGRRQKAEGRRQKAEGRRQKAKLHVWTWTRFRSSTA